MDAQPLSRLALVTVTGALAPRLLVRLEALGFEPATMASLSLLSETGATLLVGVAEDDLERLAKVTGELCGARPRMVEIGFAAGPFSPRPQMMIEAEVGGARLLVLPVERHERLGGGR